MIRIAVPIKLVDRSVVITDNTCLDSLSLLGHSVGF